tara:strand:- start:621 stop:1871 length:1251 start_codon:yes stop_codon:yes gene_type:complete
MKVENWPISKPIPYSRNPRRNEAAISKVAGSIKEFGWRQPIVVDTEGVIIAGHTRLLAAQKLGLLQVPVHVATDLSPQQIKAYRLADNRVAQEAEWDMDLLKLELSELEEEGFSLDLTGFSEDELEALLAEGTEDGLTDEDSVLEVGEQSVTVEGDVWVLGRHRLMCGDSTNVQHVERLMDGQKADMVFTSPPYNANAKAGQGEIFNKKKSVKLYADGYSDNLPSQAYVDFAASVLEVCFAVTDGFIFWNVSYNAKSRFEYIQQISGRLSYLVEQICWKKTSTIPFKGSLMRDWEPIYVFSTNKQPVAVKEVTSNFWQVSNTGSQAENHKACFPVELPERGIAIVAKNTGIVFEPFGGTGTTIIACEKTNRDCRMMELDHAYCDVIIKRWQQFTGKEAILESSGKTFAEVEAERKG